MHSPAGGPGAGPSRSVTHPQKGKSGSAPTLTSATLCPRRAVRPSPARPPPVWALRGGLGSSAHRRPPPANSLSGQPQTLSQENEHSQMLAQPSPALPSSAVPQPLPLPSLSLPISSLSPPTHSAPPRPKCSLAFARAAQHAEHDEHAQQRAISTPSAHDFPRGSLVALLAQHLTIIKSPGQVPVSLCGVNV